MQLALAYSTPPKLDLEVAGVNVTPTNTIDISREVAAVDAGAIDDECVYRHIKGGAECNKAGTADRPEMQESDVANLGEAAENDVVFEVSDAIERNYDVVPREKHLGRPRARPSAKELTFSAQEASEEADDRHIDTESSTFADKSLLVATEIDSEHQVEPFEQRSAMLAKYATDGGRGRRDFSKLKPTPMEDQHGNSSDDQVVCEEESRGSETTESHTGIVKRVDEEAIIRMGGNTKKMDLQFTRALGEKGKELVVIEDDFAIVERKDSIDKLVESETSDDELKGSGARGSFLEVSAGETDTGANTTAFGLVTDGSAALARDNQGAPGFALSEEAGAINVERGQTAVGAVAKNATTNDGTKPQVFDGPSIHSKSLEFGVEEFPFVSMFGMVNEKAEKSFFNLDYQNEESSGWDEFSRTNDGPNDNVATVNSEPTELSMESTEVSSPDAAIADEHALVSFELAESMIRLAETRLELSRLEGETAALRNRLGELEQRKSELAAANSQN
jgi:hypothetical protein